MKEKLSVLILSALLTMNVMAQKTEISILAVNDMHGAIDNFQNLNRLTDSLKRVCSNLLIVAGGDNRTGNPLNDKYCEPSYPITALMNAVGFNFSILGNHEFDAKPENFIFQAQHSNFPFLCANMEFENPDYSKWVKPYRIISFGDNGPRIAFLGILQRNVKTHIPDMHPDNAQGLKFFQEDSTIIKYKSLKDSADALILVSHCGYDVDTAYARKYSDLFDVIIGAHTHTLLTDNLLNHNVLITQAKRDLKYAALITLTFEGKKLINRSSKYFDLKQFPAHNDRIAFLLDNFNNNPIMKRVLGQAETDFSNREELSGFMGDALLDASGAEIAIINVGSIRYESFPKGDITVKDILSLDPFGNESIKYSITGKQLKELLTACHSADEYGSAYVKGCNYTIVIDKKNHKKVKSITIYDLKGKPLNDTKLYSIVSSSYVVSSLKINQMTSDIESCGKTTSDAMSDYLLKVKTVNYKGCRHLTEIIK